MSTAERSFALLDELAQATREARFDRLPALVSALEAHLARGGVKARPAALRRRIEENRRLLAAAAEGVAAARRRVAEVTAGLSTLNTYDASGRRNAVRPGRENFEHKA